MTNDLQVLLGQNCRASSKGCWLGQRQQILLIGFMITFGFSLQAQAQASSSRGKHPRPGSLGLAELHQALELLRSDPLSEAILVSATVVLE